MRKSIYLVIFVLSLAGLYAGGDVIVSDEIKLHSLDENVWIHVSEILIEPWGIVRANGLAVRSGKTLILVDTPWNDAQTETLVEWFIQNYEVDTVKLIAGHYHNDNIGGLNWILEQGYDAYAADRTLEICKEHNLPLAQNRIGDDHMLQFDEVSVRVYFPGEGHTVDSMSVYLPKQKILFGGCSVKALSNRGLGNTADANVAAWPESLRNLKNEFPEAEIVIPGHGKSGGLDLIDHTLSLFN